MKMDYLMVGLVILTVAVFGCTQTTAPDTMEKNVLMEKTDSMKNSGEMGKDSMMEKDSMEGKEMMEGYNGRRLNGNGKIMYLEFNKADYEKALKEKKKILLYFYANWCPICKTEQPNTISAFNEIKDSELIGFRVNFNDGETDVDEKALAKELNVVYQHTKVILVDGKKYGNNYPDSWNKEKYLEALSKI